MGTPVPNRQIENNSTGSSEVKEYKLSPEEIAARYGPPKARKNNDPDMGKVVRAVNASKNWEEAARKLGMNTHRLKYELGIRRIKPEWGKLKNAEEAEEMEAAVNYIVQDQGPEVKKTRIEIAREKLTREKFQKHKAEGMTDKVILTKHEIPVDVYYQLKKEYCIPVQSAQEPEATEKAAAGLGEDITWVIPFNREKIPAVRLTGKHLYINAYAVKSLKGVRDVRVGMMDRTIVLVPTKNDDPKRYRVGDSSIGSSAVVKQLKDNGILEGRYQLVYNMKKGWWEADTSECFK